HSKNYYREDCPPSKAVHLETRSILGIARFLSYGVHVPESDLQKGYAYQLKNSDGTPYEMHTLFHNLFTVYSCDKEPSDTYVKTFYRGHWFYIKSADIDAKVTFTFLQRLMTLIAGSQATIPQSAPVLTIPV